MDPKKYDYDEYLSLFSIIILDGPIAVFHEGKIIQKGKHDDLLEDIDGKYYELWNSQAQYYKDEVGA